MLECIADRPAYHYQVDVPYLDCICIKQDDQYHRQEHDVEVGEYHYLFPVPAVDQRPNEWPQDKLGYKGHHQRRCQHRGRAGFPGQVPCQRKLHHGAAEQGSRLAGPQYEEFFQDEFPL